VVSHDLKLSMERVGLARNKIQLLCPTRKTLRGIPDDRTRFDLQRRGLMWGWPVGFLQEANKVLAGGGRGVKP